MKVALVYDRVNKWGGAERVLQALHELWPEAPLFTSVYDPKGAGWILEGVELNSTPQLHRLDQSSTTENNKPSEPSLTRLPSSSWDVQPSFLNSWPFAKRHHEYYFWAMPHAFESFDFDDFDVIISITSAEAKGIITKPHQLHLCYMLTPTRYLWSHAHKYLGHQEEGAELYSAPQLYKPWPNIITKTHELKKSSLTRLLQALFLHPMFSSLRQWDYLAAQRPDVIVPISEHVATRVRKYYRREPNKVIYPPVETEKFQLNSKLKAQNSKLNSKLKIQNSYHLVVSRLVNYKNIDTVIQAFKELPGEQLVIVGAGTEEKNLKRMAGSNIHFIGSVSDEELVTWYSGAKALIFPQEEDFGITAVEAQAAGIPVLAWRMGGALETVKEGQTGLFFDTLNPEAIVAIVKKCSAQQWDSDTIAAYTKAFSRKRFQKAFKQLVEDAWISHQQNR